MNASERTLDAGTAHRDAVPPRKIETAAPSPDARWPQRPSGAPLEPRPRLLAGLLHLLALLLLVIEVPHWFSEPPPVEERPIEVTLEQRPPAPPPPPPPPAARRTAPLAASEDSKAGETNPDPNAPATAPSAAVPGEAKEDTGAKQSAPMPETAVTLRALDPLPPPSQTTPSPVAQLAPVTPKEGPQQRLARPNEAGTSFEALRGSPQTVRSSLKSKSRVATTKNAYLACLNASISNYGYLLRSAQLPLELHDLEIGIVLGADGAIEGSTLIASSGSRDVDRAAQQMVALAKPCGAVPEDLLNGGGETELLFSVDRTEIRAWIDRVRQPG